MELQQLKYFVEIAKTQNISAAAKKLYIAQPSLSQTLKRLESEVGMPLFDRVGKSIVLNPAGEVFLKYVNQVFSSLDNADRELKSLDSNAMSNVCICAQSASLLLPDIVLQIRSKYPNIHLQLVQQTDVEDMPWDLMIYSDCVRPRSDSYVKLLTEPIGVVMPQSHPLANKEVIYRKDLESESFISLSSRHNLHKEISYYCDRIGWSPKITTYVDSPNVMRDLLKIDIGVAFVPKYTWHSFYDETLVFKQISDMPMTRDMFLFWDASRYMTPSAHKCKDIIIQCFNELL